MMMTACSFLLPPMAGEKVTLNGFAFVGCLAYLLYFASTLPFHSREMPIIGRCTYVHITHTHRDFPNFVLHSKRFFAEVLNKGFFPSFRKCPIQ